MTWAVGAVSSALHRRTQPRKGRPIAVGCGSRMPSRKDFAAPSRRSGPSGNGRPVRAKSFGNRRCGRRVFFIEGLRKAPKSFEEPLDAGFRDGKLPLPQQGKRIGPARRGDSGFAERLRFGSVAATRTGLPAGRVRLLRRMNEAARKKEEGVDKRNGCGRVTNPPTTKRPRKARPCRRD